MTPWNTTDPVFSFVYRADGLRIKKVKQAQQDVPIAEMLESGPEQLQGEDEEMKPVWIGYETNYLYDGQMPVCEQDFEDGVLQQTRIHLLGARGIEGIITVPSNGSPTLNWLFYDGHGNMVRTMNTAFALSGFQWRGVWGERTNSTPGRGYCANLGHPEDETGLVYMRARYYEPTTGRFISEDPARDGGNWYLYADGDPVGKVDADGKEAYKVGMFVCALLYALARVAIDAYYNPALALAFAGWFTGFLMQCLFASMIERSMGMTTHNTAAIIFSGLPAGMAAIAILAARETPMQRAESQLDNSSLQRQIKTFYQGYATLLFISAIILVAEVGYATGSFP